MSDTAPYDVIIVGAGTAGLPCAIWASRRGARVLLLDAASDIGGTLHLSSGQMSAAGTKLQQRLGISDSPQAHFDDIIRISRDTVDRDLVRLAVWNAADTFDWLEDRGFVPIEGHPVDGQAHEPYSERRYYWGPEEGRSILKVLRAEFEAERAEGRIDLRLEHNVEDLVQDDYGTVRGVVATGPDGAKDEHSGRAIVLTCGGYAANATLFKELSGYDQRVDHSYPFSQGWGIKLGVAAGGYARGAENYLAGLSYLLDGDRFPAKPLGRAIHHPQKRLPWEIWVNRDGRRFIREDMPSVDAREHALLEQPELRWWMIFDAGILDDADSPPIAGWDAARFRQACEAGDSPFFRGTTLEALAEAAGIDPAGLATSVRGYNYGVESGHDWLGRTHCPRKIETGPFYAIRLQGGSVSSTVGLAVNDRLEVVREDGKAVPGLYAAGELLGSGQLMGSAFCGGMMATPAMTFGRLLGQRLLPVGNAEVAAAAE